MCLKWFHSRDHFLWLGLIGEVKSITLSLASYLMAPSISHFKDAYFNFIKFVNNLNLWMCNEWALVTRLALWV